MRHQPRNQQNQSGAAVVMALFIVVLCTLAISPLIWNLFATAKTISVAAARDQADAVSVSGVDWARVILREDARVSTTDTLTEPWAVPLAESRINEGLMRKEENATETDDREVVLTGVDITAWGLDLGEGDAYNKVMVDRAERRLNNLGFFTKVRITNEPGSAPDRVVVNIDVEDKATGSFSVAGGYSTSDGVIGEVSLSESNFLGRGQFVRIAGTPSVVK